MKSLSCNMHRQPIVSAGHIAVNLSISSLTCFHFQCYQGLIAIIASLLRYTLYVHEFCDHLYFTAMLLHSVCQS